MAPDVLDRLAARGDGEGRRDYLDVTWRTPDTAPPPLLAAIVGDLPERTDVYQRVRWYSPSVMKLTAGVVPSGAGEAEGARPMLLSIDGASARVRRRLERLIAEEKAGATPPAGPLLARMQPS